jgi:hypothetical protein
MSQTVSLTAAWLLLSAATLLATFLGHQSDGAAVRLVPTMAAGILLIAFVKVGLVMAYFMELRWAPYALVATAAAWVIVECSLLIGLFAR